MPSLQTSVVREIQINASPETVFSYLVEESKLRRWFSIAGGWEPRAGAQYRLQVTKEDIASGKFIEVSPPTKLVFSFGWEGDDVSIRPGSSTVEITLTPHGSGTIVRLAHSGIPTEESAQRHGRGWQHYLDRLAIAASGGDPGRDEFQD
jgi:uncharacterized protein YndB with AHSA1/START domain